MLSQRPTLVIALVLALIVSAGIAINIWLSQPTVTEQAAPAPRRLANLPNDAVWASPKNEPAAPKAASREAAGASNGPVFDIIRIDPAGQSVFAGRAEPGAEIAVLAGGREIARTKAASDGTWSIVTGGIYKGGDVPFRIAATKDGRTVVSDAVMMAVPVTPVAEEPPARVASAAKEKPVEPRAAEPRVSASDAAATRQLERLVEEVRTNPAAANNPDRAPEIIPLPITFESGRTVFTAEGRRAAVLLVEYVKGAGLRTLTLSGHADERGPDRYNLRLSRKRLEAIAEFLREQGYSGRMRLLAKGESEPFQGVDRVSTPRELLWRVDRRVELRTR